MLFINCTNKIPAGKIAILQGQINNNTSTEMRLLRYDRTLDTILQIKKDVFIDTVFLNKPGLYSLANGSHNYSLYLEPGYDLKASLDIKKYPQIKFTGTGSDMNNYMVKKQQTLREMQGGFEAFYGLSPKDFKATLKKMDDSLKILLKKYPGIPEKLKQKELRSLTYFKTVMLFQYDIMQYELDEKMPPENLLRALADNDTIDLDNTEDFTYSIYYMSIIKEHYRYKVKDLLEEYDEKNKSLPPNKKISPENVHFEVFSGISNETIKNTLLFNYADVALLGVKDKEAFYNAFMKISTNNEHKRKITADYNKITKLAPGSPSPQFKDYENHDGGTTSLDDLKGKYVYIDLWATWCGPCIAEFPALKRLQEKYIDKDITFLSISIDKEEDYEKWKKMVDEKELQGIQLYANDNSNESFRWQYEVNYIPRFIFLDPDGNIISAEAPSPSSPEIKKLFDTSLDINPAPQV
tara:strand:+ start:4779 stop:6176 length:1398 start_codon:yes stop_codon:yes gene_type:complete